MNDGGGMRTIREWREARGISQAELARLVGVSVVTAYRWDHQKSEPTARQLRAIARVLDVSMDDVAFEMPERGRPDE